MKHTDYMAVHRCSKCGKAVWIPREWKSKRWEVPVYPTCQHVEKKENKRL